jgi:hypothetical protein
VCEAGAGAVQRLDGDGAREKTSRSRPTGAHAHQSQTPFYLAPPVGRATSYTIFLARTLEKAHPASDPSTLLGPPRQQYISDEITRRGGRRPSVGGVAGASRVAGLAQTRPAVVDLATGSGRG